MKWTQEWIEGGGEATTRQETALMNYSDELDFLERMSAVLKTN